MQFSMQTPMTRVEEQGLLGFLRYRSEAKTSGKATFLSILVKNSGS